MKIILGLGNFFKLCMKSIMFISRCKKQQVFNSIVMPNLINVMHYFTWFEKTPNMFFHDKTMFRNISLSIPKRMLMSFYMNIPLRRLNSSAFPVITFFHSLCKRNIFSVFFSEFFPFTSHAQSFSPLHRKGFSFLSKMSQTNIFSMFKSFWFISKRSYSITFMRTSLPSFKFRFISFKPFFTNNTFFKHRLSYLFFILAFNIICCQYSLAADQWRNDGSEHTILGTESVSDIDSASYNNIVSPLDRLLANYRQGLKITYASASTLTVGSGSVVVSNSDGSARLMLKNNASTTVDWTMLDTGSESSSTTYYIYGCATATSDTTITFRISASSSAPTGVTYYKRLGVFYNDSSSNILNDETITNDDNYYGSELGDWDSKSFGTNYLAATDGFAVAHITCAGGTYNGDMRGYTDSAASPTTEVVSDSCHRNASTPTYVNYGGFSMPVKRGHYYRVDSSVSGATATLRWIPLQIDQ